MYNGTGAEIDVNTIYDRADDVPIDVIMDLDIRCLATSAFLKF